MFIKVVSLVVVLSESISESISESGIIGILYLLTLPNHDGTIIMGLESLII